MRPDSNSNDIQRIIIFDGPDGTGKTNIAQALSRKINVPYFKMNTEPHLWRENQFKTALEFDQPFMQQVLSQTKYDIVWDRAYPSEWVYSQVYDRPTNMDLLALLDEQYAKMGAWIVVPMRSSYEENRVDEFVNKDHLYKLHDKYNEFCDSFTKCNTLRMYVDTYNNDLMRELACIMSNVKFSFINQDRISIVSKGNR